jgi:hypothetical protein
MVCRRLAGSPGRCHALLPWLPKRGQSNHGQRSEDESVGYLWLAHCLVASSNYMEVIEAIHGAQEIWKKQEMTALLGFACAQMGLPDEAQAVLDEPRIRGERGTDPRSGFTGESGRQRSGNRGGTTSCLFERRPIYEAPDTDFIRP